ncbi:MAG: hypothetical protein CMO80_16515 [Verrucomicrobiales bacterium]|nr:hypothetical protein [Verrucomicrobiales bacterium]|tara:strand:- start:1889 stop:2272 length:384 start_codon:yes stop_codon:yes gene_type:complete
MADNGDKSKDNHGNRAAVIAVLVILLLVVIQTIQRQQTAGSGGPGMSGDGPPEMPPAVVIVAPVKSETMQEFAVVTGTLRAVFKADVVAKEAGAVEKIRIDEIVVVDAENRPVGLIDVQDLSRERIY